MFNNGVQKKPCPKTVAIATTTQLLEEPCRAIPALSPARSAWRLGVPKAAADVQHTLHFCMAILLVDAKDIKEHHLRRSAQHEDDQRAQKPKAQAPEPLKHRLTKARLTGEAWQPIKSEAGCGQDSNLRAELEPSNAEQQKYIKILLWAPG